MSHGYMYGHLQRHGRDATVYNYDETGTDDGYGDHSYTETSESTKVIIDRDPAAATVARQREEGQQAGVDAEIYVDNDVTIRDANGGERPTEIALDGQRYEVQVSDPFDDYYRLFVRRM